MLFFPKVFVGEITLDIIKTTSSFGVGALSVAVLSFLLLIFKHPSALKVGLITLTVYQLGIAILQVINPMENVPAWLPPLFHSIFVVGFILYVFRVDELFKKHI